MALDEKRLAVIEWLVDPERTGTLKELAEKLGVTPATAYRWKNEPDFRQEWDRRLVELNVKPDRVQSVVEQLWRTASTPGRDQVKAAQLYLQYIDRYTPKVNLVTDKRELRELSDEELDAMLAEAAKDELDERKLRLVQ